MRGIGLHASRIVSGALVTGFILGVGPGDISAQDKGSLIAQLPPAPSWKSETIQRGEDGQAVPGTTIQPSTPSKPQPRGAAQEAPGEKTPEGETGKDLAAGTPAKPAKATQAETVERKVEEKKAAEKKPATPKPAGTKAADQNLDPMRFAVAQAEMPKLAQIVDDLKPGQWYELPNSAISQVLATRSMAPENGGVSGPGSVVKSWNGATFDGRFWYFHGGGHRDYSGNEVYAFDFAELTWERLTDPSPFVYLNPKTNRWDAKKSQEHPCPRVPDLDGDGKFDAPVPGHTYDSIVYSPKTETIFVWTQVAYCAGGNGWSGAPIWEFDPKTKSWTGHNPANSKRIGGYRSAELDPATGNIILVSRGRMSVFDVESKEYASMGNVNSTGTDGTGIVDPDRRLFILSDRTGVRSARLGNGTRLGNLENRVKRPAFNQTAGPAYNSRDKNIVYWSGDRRIFTLDPETKEWVLYENRGGEAPSRSRPYSKFIYIEALDVFAGYGHPNNGIWLYRLPKEKPPVDPNRFVSLCNGDDCQKFPRLGAAFNAAQDGAVITIGGATFYESAVLRANNVTVRGSKNTRLLETTAEGKANLVIKGNNTTIEGIECSGIRVSDGNGACVRLEGNNLTLRNVYFHNSQQGLLTRSKGGGSILIENSKFEHLGGACGIKCGRAHGIYIGKAAELTVRDSVFLSPKDEGHAIKSRAARTTIENNVIASLEGKDSRLIDIPNGGTVVIRNNVLQEGVNSSNPDIIGIGLELTYPRVTGYDVNSSLIEGNTVIIEPAQRQRNFVHSRDVPPPKISENTLIGGRKPTSENHWYKNREDAGLDPYPALPEVK